MDAAAQIPRKVAGAPPLLDVSTRALDQLPTTCVEATVTVSAAGLPASLVEYSLDSGANWTPIPLNRLPYRFVIPGSGFFHLVARAFDAAGQSTADGEQFFTASPCTTGTPKLSSSVGAHGASGGKYFVDVTLTNNGAGLARAVAIGGMRVTPIGGGTATIDVAQTGATPLLVGDIAAGTSRTVRVWLNLTGVSRVSLTETGSFTDYAASRTLSFSLSQSVITN